MISDEVITAMKQRYDIFPLLLQRSVEQAQAPADLFDILDTIPEGPVVWDKVTRRWITSSLF